MVLPPSTLAANIRRRRGSKVAINLPIFRDSNTPSPFIDTSIPFDRELYSGDGEAKAGAAKPEHIYMDAMAFGMGCCCLQITFQATDLQEALRVYDALVPVAPIMVGVPFVTKRWASALIISLPSACSICCFPRLSWPPGGCRLPMGRHCGCRR